MFSHKSQKGFTLIEIVLVLVLIAILAAVALSKYYDLKYKAQEDAAQAFANSVAAEFNARVSELILSGKTCEQAKYGWGVEGTGVINELGVKYMWAANYGFGFNMTPIYTDAPTTIVYDAEDNQFTVKNSIVSCDKYTNSNVPGTGGDSSGQGSGQGSGQDSTGKGS